MTYAVAAAARSAGRGPVAARSSWEALVAPVWLGAVSPARRRLALAARGAAFDVRCRVGLRAMLFRERLSVPVRLVGARGRFRAVRCCWPSASTWARPGASAPPRPPGRGDRVVPPRRRCVIVVDAPRHPGRPGGRSTIATSPAPARWTPRPPGGAPGWRPTPGPTWCCDRTWRGGGDHPGRPGGPGAVLAGLHPPSGGAGRGPRPGRRSRRHGVTERGRRPPRPAPQTLSSLG